MSSSVLNKITAIPLWQQTTVALLLGVAVGIWYADVALMLAPLGQLFINAIQLLVVPVVFVSIVCGVLSLSSHAAMGRVTLKTVVIYTVTMVVAAVIGIIVSEIIQPGAGLDLSHLAAEAPVVNIPQTSMDNLLTGLIPANLFSTLSANTMLLQVIVAAILFGIAIMRAGEKAEPVVRLFESAFSVMMQFAQFIMKFVPIGVFSLMAVAVGKFGSAILMELLLLVVCIYIGCLLQLVVVYSGMLRFISHLNPLPFFRGLADAMVFAFSTSSSAATLPITLRCTQEKLGVHKSIAEFVVPLGATINMNGVGVYLSVVAIFAANLFGIELTTWEFMLIILTSMIAGVGAAGIPGGGLFVMAIVMSSIGIPLTAIAIVAAVDRIVDMIVTMLNVSGDAVTAVIVAKSENMLDETVYNQSHQ